MEFGNTLLKLVHHQCPVLVEERRYRLGELCFPPALWLSISEGNSESVLVIKPESRDTVRSEHHWHWLTVVHRLEGPRWSSIFKSTAIQCLNLVTDWIIGQCVKLRISAFSKTTGDVYKCHYRLWKVGLNTVFLDKSCERAVTDDETSTLSCCGGRVGFMEIINEYKLTHTVNGVFYARTMLL